MAAIVDEQPGGHAVLVGGGVAVAVGQDHAAVFAGLGQNLIEIRPPGPVVIEVAGVGLPGAIAPVKVGGDLRALGVTQKTAQQPRAM